MLHGEPPVYIVEAFALSMQGDTLIQGNSYKKIYQRILKKNAGSTAIQNPKEILNTYLYGLMRDDTNTREVYLLPYDDIAYMCQSTEHLLYDFSLQEGDTLNDCVLENLYAPWVPSVPRIDSIRPFVFSGLASRAFYTQGVFVNYGDLFYDIGRIFEGFGYEAHGLINYGRKEFLTEFQYFCEGDSLDCELLSAIEEPGEKLGYDFTLFPNPADDILIVQIDPSYRKETELQVYLLNAMGNVILHTNWNIFKDLKLNVSNLHNGMYFLSIHGERVSAIKSIVIVR